MNEKKYLADEKLIEELRAQRSAGAEALYDMYSNTLFGVLVKMVDDQDLAESLLQQSLARISASIQSYDPSKISFFTWMIAITRNLAKDYLSRNQNHERLIIDPVAFNNRPIKSRQSQFSIAAATTIKSGARKIMHEDVLELIYYKGCTPAEVAEELKIPINMVRIYYRRAICIMREQFA